MRYGLALRLQHPRMRFALGRESRWASLSWCWRPIRISGIFLVVVGFRRHRVPGGQGRVIADDGRHVWIELLHGVFDDGARISPPLPNLDFEVAFVFSGKSLRLHLAGLGPAPSLKRAPRSASSGRWPSIAPSRRRGRPRSKRRARSRAASHRFHRSKVRSPRTRSI
jgi:hypothetical protein